MTTIVLVQQGGTGSNNASDARVSLGAAPSEAYDQANAAFNAANTGSTSAGAAYDQANAAYIQANTGTSIAQSAYGQANTAYDQANAAYLQANTARSDANATFATINTTFTTLNSSSATQNTTITNAHNQANSAYAEANLKLNISGGTINGSLNVSGNLTITGNTKYVNVNTYIVTDPLIYLAANNDTSDLVDIGFMGGHNTAGVYQHSGLARDAGDGTWYLFTGLSDEGHENNVVDFANTSLATLRANINANSITTELLSITSGVSGNVNFDSGTLFVDSVNNRVGIGTTVPIQALEVVSPSAGDGIRISANGTNSPGFRLYSDSSNAFAQNLLVLSSGHGVSGTVPGDYLLRNAGGGAILFATNDAVGNTTTEKMRIANTGNVGIGNTAPDVKLVVEDLVSSTVEIKTVGTTQSIFRTIAANTGIGYFAFGDTDDGYIGGVSYSHTDDALSFYANNATRLTIDSAGNVGIGTTSPTAKLHIAGERIKTESGSIADNTTVGGRTFAISGVENASVSGRSGFVNIIQNEFSAVNNNAGFQHLFPFDGNYDMYAFRASIGSTLSDTFWVKQKGSAYFAGSIQADGGAVFNENGADVDFRIESDTNANAFFLDGANGNVGVGTTPVAAHDKFTIGGTAPSFGGYSLGYINRGVIPSGTTVQVTGYSTGMSTAAASFTVSDWYHFQVYAPTLGAGSGITNQYGFLVPSTLTNATNNYGFYSGIASGANRWNFYAAGTAANYFAGSVLIGTTTATAPLTVLTNNGTDDSTARVAVLGLSNVNQGQLEFRSGRDDGALAGRYSSIQAWSNSLGSARDLILEPEGGNVGIGTASPASKLDIYTNVAAGYVYPLFFSANNNAAAKRDYLQVGFSIQQSLAGSETAGFDLKGLRNNTPVYLCNYEGAAGLGTWKFYTDGTERMRIDASGNVGIGLTSPTAKLDVYGGAIAAGLSQLSIGNALTTTATLSPSNWYRLATLTASNQGATVEIHVRIGGTHNNTIIKVSKGTGNWRAEVYRAGLYVDPSTVSAYVGIDKVRVYDVGINNVTHIDIKIAGNTTSITYNVVVMNEVTLSNTRTTLVALTDQGTGAAGVEFQAIGVMASWGHSASGQAVTFRENGNVGIGTASPSQKLDVVGTVQASTFTATQAAAFVGLTLDRTGAAPSTGSISNGGNLLTLSYNGTGITFNTGGTPSEKVRITSGGNVGIGTTSPGSKLQVNGVVTAAGTDATTQLLVANSNGGFTNDSAIALQRNAVNMGLIAADYFQGMRFSVTNGSGAAATERMRIDTSGNVGIGTSSPAQKLHVVGQIIATDEITAFYSDDRLKTKLGNIDNALSKVLSLNGFLYEPNQTAVELGYEKKKNVGVSAQEVKTVLPEAVVDAPIDDKYMTVHYHKLVPLLIEAIKDLNAKVESMQKIIDEKK